MILYCDTSALIKLYLQEADSEHVREQLSLAELLSVSRIAWVEAMSALARRTREQPEATALIDRARRSLMEHWATYLTIELTPPIAELAGEYTDTFALRAYDSVQLASAQTTNLLMPGEVKFACFDTRLNKAARLLGMSVL